ncbi:hypothetical protein SMJ63A_80021 [Stenotrophomonas geniculata]
MDQERSSNFSPSRFVSGYFPMSPGESGLSGLALPWWPLGSLEARFGFTSLESLQYRTQNSSPLAKFQSISMFLA